MSETYLESINSALHEMFDEDGSVFLIGEDILDPYGGAFKVSKGLSTKYPDRVLTTPISEACITGIGAGLALRGMKPIIEIMFGDFLTLSANQIIDHIAKFEQMYNFQVKVPIVIRTPMGGGRGYGPTHSQSMEKIFFGVPGLKVIAPSHFHNPGNLLKHATIIDTSPLLFIEHKLLYPKQLILENKENLFVQTNENNSGYPDAIVRNFDEGEADIVIFSYGGNSQTLEVLMNDYVGEEIRIIAIFPSLINKINIIGYSDIIKKTKKVLIIEEGPGEFGWGGELASHIYDSFGLYLEKPIKRLSSCNSIIPSAKHLENLVLPNKSKIEKMIGELL